MISCLIVGCEKSSSNHTEFQVIDLKDNEFSRIEKDSVYLLIPSKACFECTKNAFQLIELFGNKKNCLIVFYGNNYSRDFKILFKSEISTYSNIVLDEIGKWESYVFDDPISIWVVFSLRENRLRYRVRLTEENIPLLKSVIDKLNI